MKTVDELITASARLGPPASDRDRRKSGGIWADEYVDYAQMSDVVRSEYVHHLDLRYGGDPRQILDVYLPKELTAPAPVFVFFHGGAMEEGHPRRYGFVGAPYLARGAIYISAGYRLLSDELVARRGVAERELGGLVHALQGESSAELTEIRRGVAQAGVDAAGDGRAAVAWVHQNIAAFGGDPDRITVGGHSSGAMISVAVSAADDWQEPAGVPANVVKAMVSVGGRYGLWLANAVISGGDIVDPPRQWRLGRPVRSVVVFGEEEYDGAGVAEDSGRAKDCALIGRSLIVALRADGSEVTEMALSPRGHWETLRSLQDEDDRTLPAVLEAMGIDA